MPNVSVPIAIQKRDYILQELSNGKLVRQIADELGCHRMSISHTLAADPEYQAAIHEALEARLEMADIALETAHDGLSLQRAREQHVAARWRAERLYSSKYGQRPSTAVQINGEGSGMTVNIVSYADESAPGAG